MTVQTADPTLVSQTAYPQLVFEIDSAGAPSTIYVTGTASDNDLTLKIATTASATFSPAPHVVDKPQAPTATGSLLYLDLTPLNLTAAEFAAISPTPSDWTMVAFPDDQLIGMTPEADVTIGPSDSIELHIGALADPQATGASASLTVTAFRVAGITIGSLPFPSNFSVALATPPDGGEALSQDLLVELATPDVVNSIPAYDPVANQLAFAFYAGPRGRPVVAGAETQFTLSFVYSSDPSGYGALCTTDEVKPPFEVVSGVNAGAWKITANRSQQSPSWTLRPPPKHPIVGTGPLATVGILANDLVTTFQPGPTVALISYTGLTGYADGVFTLPMTKHAHVSIGALSVKPNPTVLADGSAAVTVSWQAENAGTMTLAPFDVNVTGKTSYPAVITDTTPISLTAEGTYLASAGNIALANTTAVVQPVINSFGASPRAVYAGDLPRDVALSWNVNTNDKLQLVSSTGDPDPDQYGAIGTVSKPISGPQMFTLVPLGQSEGPAVERSIIVSAFAPQVQPRAVAAAYLAAPPNASFILASDGRTVSAVDTMVYQPVSGTIPVGASPAGMAFSSDGSILYVANSGDGTVSALDVTATGAVPQYGFTTRSTTTVGGAPQRVALSPDGAYLYVTVDGGSQPGKLVVLSTAGTPVVVDNLTVGVAPRGVAVMPSGAQLFVANSGSSTVTVIGRGPNGRHSVVDSITGLSAAQDVAVTADGDVVLVACPTANAVVALNAIHPQAPRATLTVGNAPQQLALLPGGAYAVVTNQGDGTVSLLSAGSTPSQCTLLEAGIQVGSSPGAIAATPDGGLVLVGTGGGGGLAVVTLAEYQTGQAPPAIGGQPTDVAVSPDDTKVVAWHSARETFSPGHPSTGLFVYDVASEVVTPELASTPVVDFVHHPDAAAATGFLADDTHASVTILSTASWTATGTIDLSAETDGLPTGLAVSSDGTTLFVLTASASRAYELVVYALAGSPPMGTALGTVKLLTGSPGSAVTLAAAPDGSKAYVTDEVSGNLLVVARGNDDSYALSGSPVAVGSLPVATALSPDGTGLYIACEGMSNNGSLAVVDTATLALQSVILPANAYTSLGELVVSPDGTRVLATDAVAAGVRVFDAASLRLVQTIQWNGGVEWPNGIAVAADGSRIFTTNIVSGNLGVVAQVQAAASGALRHVPHPTVVAAELAPAAGLGSAPYQGLFLRDYVGQTPQSGNTTGAWTTCPDIWFAGQQPLPDPQTTLVGGYGNDSPSTVYIAAGGGQQPIDNYVYVRGLNATNGANRSRVWLYYVNGGGDPSLMLWPPSWLNAGIAAANTYPAVGYVEVPSAALNEIDFTYPPFIWNAVPVSGHYCMIAWVENPPLSQPATDPRAGIGSLGTWNDLATFVQTTPNMGWKNTVEQATTQGQSWVLDMPLQGPPVGGLFKCGLQFNNVPTDGYFAFSITGPTPQGSVSVPKTPITSIGETYLTPIDWTGSNNYTATMSVSYWAGATPMPKGANITPAAGSSSRAQVGLVQDPLVGAIRADVYPSGLVEDGFEQEWLTIVGSVQVNLT
ncbi:beta-propeller fold lactonase family protein [Candidatus Solirubrobacter pratensis]|uniref:beta-propeller fold lactonase family protein n=1 Tax=Candidatus Solirubrobacter pratensis TaxID=1298857 RepID=UPI0003FF3747|nr:beta-propeller fold lactonase family protein [Candidatus Solirubrobacter pratensis]